MRLRFARILVTSTQACRGRATPPPRSLHRGDRQCRNHDVMAVGAASPACTSSLAKICG